MSGWELGKGSLHWGLYLTEMKYVKNANINILLQMFIFLPKQGHSNFVSGGFPKERQASIPPPLSSNAWQW